MNTYSQIRKRIEKLQKDNKMSGLLMDNISELQINTSEEYKSLFDMDMSKMNENNFSKENYWNGIQDTTLFHSTEDSAKIQINIYGSSIASFMYLKLADHFHYDTTGGLVKSIYGGYLNSKTELYHNVMATSTFIHYDGGVFALPLFQQISSSKRAHDMLEGYTELAISYNNWEYGKNKNIFLWEKEKFLHSDLDKAQLKVRLIYIIFLLKHT